MFSKQLLPRNLVLEILAVVSSALYTLLITYGSIWCWPFALLGSALFMYLVWNKRLYAETCLHTFYFLIGIYGWLSWGQAGTFSVSSLGLTNNMYIIGLGVIVALGVGFLFKRYTQAAWPFVDSFTAVFSIIATFMMIAMLLENWLYFIVVDAVSIALYASRKLYLSSLLYVVYTLLAINGFIQWLHGYENL
ncbi:MAG: nicotinamide riboside transporter PnuC [Chitinophagales bacterium]|nr:nicotinamide riboside transporter PnuC [Chitinophagales bacterium]